jgi:hypothetical protein
LSNANWSQLGRGLSTAPFSAFVMIPGGDQEKTKSRFIYIGFNLKQNRVKTTILG